MYCKIFQQEYNIIIWITWYEEQHTRENCFLHFVYEYNFGALKYHFMRWQQNIFWEQNTTKHLYIDRLHNTSKKAHKEHWTWIRWPGVDFTFRVRTSPNLGLILGDIKNLRLVPSRDTCKTSLNSLWNPTMDSSWKFTIFLNLLQLINHFEPNFVIMVYDYLSLPNVDSYKMINSLCLSFKCPVWAQLFTMRPTMQVYGMAHKQKTHSLCIHVYLAAQPVAACDLFTAA